jgi:hypothetical protein
LVNEASVSLSFAKEELLLLYQNQAWIGLGVCSKELRMDATISSSGQMDLGDLCVEVVLEEESDL